jgi:nicotinamide riboside kinase
VGKFFKKTLVLIKKVRILRVMKIAFTGAQSTGKTTLLEAIKQNEQFRYKYEFIDEITRRMIKKGLKINEAGSNTTQLLIMNEHIKNVLYENAIMDRCVLDGVVYTDWLYHQGNLEKWVFDYAVNVFTHYKNRYDYIFYLKPEFPIVDDGTRSINTQFRDEIVDIFEHYVTLVDIPVISLTGTVANRLETFYNTINNHG